MVVPNEQVEPTPLSATPVESLSGNDIMLWQRTPMRLPADHAVDTERYCGCLHTWIFICSAAKTLQEGGKHLHHTCTPREKPWHAVSHQAPRD